EISTEVLIMAIGEQDLLRKSPLLKPWRGFQTGKWMERIDVNDFITLNITPYDGDEAFLQGPTEATVELWKIIQDLTKKEIKNGGVLDVDVDTVSTITSHKPGY